MKLGRVGLAWGEKSADCWTVEANLLPALLSSSLLVRMWLSGSVSAIEFSHVCGAPLALIFSGWQVNCSTVGACLRVSAGGSDKVLLGLRSLLRRLYC